MQASIISMAAMLGAAFQALVVLAVIFVPLELAFRRQPVPLVRDRLMADVAFFFLNSILPGVLLAALLSLFVPLIRPLYDTGIYGWIGSLPLAMRFSLAVIVGDIGAYWAHRWCHEIPFLWHFHKIHHQAEVVDWLVTARAHPIDMIIGKFSGVVLIYLCGLANGSLGQNTVLMSVYVLTASFWAYLVHANVAWRFGGLERWIATPAFHHWHHSNESEASIDKNYAAIFPWIDRLFGTLYLPTRRWPASYGLRVSDSAFVSPPEPASAALKGDQA